MATWAICPSPTTAYRIVFRCFLIIFTHIVNGIPTPPLFNRDSLKGISAEVWRNAWSEYSIIVRRWY